MIRVIAIDDETGERVELEGDRVLILVGDGAEQQMVHAGGARKVEVACEMARQADEKLRDDGHLPTLAATQSASQH